jgi:propane monooxygenase reductase subunit
MERLGGELEDFTFVPALSEAEDDDEWEGQTGLITDVVDDLEGDDLAEVDAYLCGPPPMVDAAIALLERRGVPEAHIYFDRFTTSAA